MYSRLLASLFALAACTTQAAAFCGFYVSRADGDLYNQGSSVVFVRDGMQSTITMSSDYSGPASEFALIVPTPTVLAEDQIRTVDPDIVSHLDGYSAPRLAEYFDGDPCAETGEIAPVIVEAPVIMADATPRNGPPALGVTVEAEYAVGIYDIQILSAEQSDGLTTYLRQEGYQLPDGSEEALSGYIDMGMKFFVARVNLQRQSAAEVQDLEPLQISFTSRDFMLPLQLGKVNSVGTQDLIMMMISREGRIEPVNYTNVAIPTDLNLPPFIEEDFADFYRDMFAHVIPDEVVVTEYAWDMAWCDPCAADPMTGPEMRALGADWVTDDGPPDAFVTRLHIQYDADEFAQDLMFQVTTDRENFQGRYVMRHPFEGEITCEEGQAYVTRTHERLEDELSTLLSYTGWDANEMISRLEASVPARFH